MNKPVVPTVDPLAALRAGKRPTARLAGGTVKISKRGVGALKITNPNGYALKGTLSLAAGKLKLGKARVSLPGGRHQGVQVQAVEEGAAAAAQEAQAARHRHGEAQGPDRQDGDDQEAGHAQGAGQAQAQEEAQVRRRGPTSNLWVARNGTTGAYDDFKFRLDGCTINLTGTSLLFVSCFEIGGSLSQQILLRGLQPARPVAPGQPDRNADKARAGAVNVLVGSGERTITYNAHVHPVGQQDHRPAEDELQRLAVRPVRQHDLVRLLLGHAEVRGDPGLTD